MEQTTDTNTLVELSKAFEKLGDYKDSQAKKAQCLEKAYTLALSHKNKGIENNNISETEVAATLFEILGNYADSNAQLEECMALKEIIRQNVAKMEKMAKQKFQKRIIAFSCTVVLLIVGYFIVKYRKYTQAISLYNEGKYIDAAEQLRALPKVFLKKNAYLTDIANEYSNIISTGNAHTVGLKSDGTVVAVGDNEYEQCNVTDWNDIVAVSAGRYHTVGLKSDGTVVAMGNNNGGQCNVTDWNDIVAVSAGKYNTVGLKSDGTVIATGYYGNDVTDWNNIVAVSAGGSHIVGLKSDGTVVAVSYSNGKCDLTGWNDIVAVSAGEDHIVGLKSDGTVVAMGDNNDDVTGWNDIVAVSAGNGHTVGLKSNGTVVAAGYNYSGQCDVTDWTDIVAVSAGWYRTVGLKSDGTVVSVGSRQCDVTGWQLSTQPHIANP